MAREPGRYSMCHSSGSSGERQCVLLTFAQGWLGLWRGKVVPVLLCDPPPVEILSVHSFVFRVGKYHLRDSMSLTYLLSVIVQAIALTRP